MIRPRSLAFLLAALACVATTAHAATLYTTSGNTIVTFDTTATNPTPKTFASTSPNSAFGLAIDMVGNVYVSTGVNFTGFNNTIERFTPGGVGSVFASTAQNEPAVYLAVDAAGNVFASGSTYNGLIIQKFTPQGVGSLFASAGLLFTPDGLAFDAAGNLYVANANGNDILKFTPQGVGSVFASTGLNVPVALAINAAGNVYVTYNSTNTIEEFSPKGVDLGVFASTGPNSTLGLAIDTAGNVYNTEANMIEKFTPAGVGSVFATGSYGLLAFAPTAVPEPSSLVLGCLALVSVAVFACARRRLRCRVA